MALAHITAARNGMADYIVDLLDLGSADAQGDLVFMTSGDVEVATLALSNPAFGASVAGVATASAISDDSNATGGTAALFKLVDRDNNELLRGTVTATSGGGDIELSSVVIGAGSTVSMTSLTYAAST